jgi:alkanesulfonate monooxygenase SsuD/methylene tetrahydromethanopterin reductase-like flavin-dependent oxidoreductase (luciferase family)
MKGLFRDGPFTYEGEHYRVNDLDGTPPPVQRPHPPLLIGAARRRMLSLAGREADIVGVAPSVDSRPFGSRPAIMSVTDATDQQIEWIRAAAGDRFDDIEVQMTAFPSLVGGDRASQLQGLSQNLQIDESEVSASPQILLGSVEEICDTIEERRERWGVSYWVVAAGVVREFAPVVERLAGK